MRSHLDTLTFDGTVSPAGDGAGGCAALDLVVNDAHALLGRPEPGGRVRIGASGEAWWSDSGITRGRLTVRGNGTVGDLVVDTVSVDATLAPDSLRLDSLRIRSNALTVRGTGVLTPHAGSGPLRIDADAPVPAPLLDLLGLRDVTVRGAALSAELRGRPDRPTGSASFSVGLVSAAGVQATRLAGTIDAGAEGAHLSAGAERIRSGPLTLWSTSAGLSFHEGEGVFRVETLPTGGARSVAAGTFMRAGDTTTVALDTLNLAPSDRAWTLDRPAVISISPDVEIRDFDLRSGASRLFADGRATGRRRNLRVKIDSLDLGRAFRPLLARPVDGVLQADLRLIDHADSTEAVLRADGVVWTADAPPERITLRAALAGPQGSLHVAWTDPEGDSLLVTAEARGDSVEIRLRAEAFGLAGPGGLVPSTRLEGLRGTLEAEVNGTLLPDRIRLSGPIRLSGVGFTAPAAGLTVDTLAADLAFGGSALTVRSARASAGGGTAALSGSVGFPSADSVDLRLGLVLKRFPAVRRRDLDALLSAELDVTGSLRYPAVTGTVTTDRVAYLLDPTLTAGAAGEVRLTAADLRMLEENFGIRLDDTAGTGPELIRNLALRLDVAIPRNVRIRSLRDPRMDVEIMGDVRVRKAAGGPPEVFAQLRPVVGRSFVEQFGRQFEIREGEIRLDGNPETPTMDIKARYEIPSRSGAGAAESYIDLRVRSSEGVLSLDLTSDPPMTQEEIFTYFITGQSDRALSSGAADQGSIAAAVALGQVVGSAQGLVDGRVPLDVFQVRQDGARGITIVGGSYVLPSLYAGFRQPIVLARDSRAPNTSDVGTEFELELEILRGFFITAEGGAERLSSFFRGRYAY
jgi:translocation and assembly module TamB